MKAAAAFTMSPISFLFPQPTTATDHSLALAGILYRPAMSSAATTTIDKITGNLHN